MFARSTGNASRMLADTDRLPSADLVQPGGVGTADATEEGSSEIMVEKATEFDEGHNVTEKVAAAKAASGGLLDDIASSHQAWSRTCIEVLSGRNLGNLVHHSETLPDCYLVVRTVTPQLDHGDGPRLVYKGKARRSGHKADNANPVWRFYADLDQKGISSADRIVVEVYDYDQFTEDDLVGVCIASPAFLDSEEGEAKECKLFGLEASTTALKSFSHSFAHHAHRLQAEVERTHVPSKFADDRLAYHPEWVDVKPAKGDPRITMRRVKHKLPHELTVYFVRHAESSWNEAQESRNVKGMLEQVDHPLNSTGIQQCQALHQAWKQARDTVGEMNSEDAREVEMFLSADAVWSSPLTRTLQTCLIGLQGHPALLSTTSGPHVTLLAAAREIKKVGGQDTVSKSLGKDVLPRARETMALDSSLTEAEVAEICDHIEIDPFDAAGRWWTNATDADSNGELEGRFYGMVSSLRHHKVEQGAGHGHTPSICVAHSLVLREFFRRFLDPELRARDPFCQQLTQDKMGNASMVKVVLDFGPGNSHKDCHVVCAQPVFGMKFAASHKKTGGVLGQIFPCCFKQHPGEDAADETDKEEDVSVGKGVGVKITNPMLNK